MKRKIAYLTVDCYTDTDITVLRQLSKHYFVVWYYICEETLRRPRLKKVDAQQYAYKYGIDLHCYDPKMRYRNPKNFFFYRKLAEDINRTNPDVVFYTHRNPYWAIAIRCFLKCRNVVLGVHDAKPHSYTFTVSRFLELATNNLALKVQDNFVTFSQNQHDQFLSVCGKQSVMVGMSCKDFGVSDKTSGSIKDGVKLLFFGSIEKYKGIDLLINALEKLRGEGLCNMTLTIAGEGPFWQECESLIRTEEMYDLKVRFIENSEIPDLMSSSHFLVLPYRNATQSGPLSTALTYELPVIAPAFGCFAETFDGNSAVLYEQGELEQALRKVSLLTQEEYSLLKTACGKVKEFNSEENIAQNYIAYFDSLFA